uniref:Uncharacterized protein n=1 Tax=Heterorhabditis bacteriophora TaxID=37862 RepID=A0A1I7WD48_HETBA
MRSLARAPSDKCPLRRAAASWRFRCQARRRIGSASSEAFIATALARRTCTGQLGWSPPSARFRRRMPAAFSALQPASPGSRSPAPASRGMLPASGSSSTAGSCADGSPSCGWPGACADRWPCRCSAARPSPGAAGRKCWRRSRLACLRFVAQLLDRPQLAVALLQAQHVGVV